MHIIKKENRQLFLWKTGRVSAEKYVDRAAQAGEWEKELRMVFSSFEFLFRFLPAFLIIYFITPKKFRNAVLFLGSIAFYTYGEAQYVLLLLASVTVNYVIARSMYKTP